MSPSLRPMVTLLFSSFTLLSAITPTLADPEGDSPPEYDWVFYEEFDPEEIIASCKALYDSKSGNTATLANTMNDRFICLENAIHEKWTILFSEETRKKQNLDAKLEMMIGLYANIYSMMAQENAGCMDSCGTMWIGHGVGKGVLILEEILRSTHYFIEKYPPRVDNPEYIEWDKAGRPPWPPQPGK